MNVNLKRVLNTFCKTRFINNYKNNLMKYSTQDGTNNENLSTEKKIGKFAQAFQKFEASLESKPATKPSVPFATLLRNSKFIDLGDPEGKVVFGKIFHIVDNDLYIDFGWKFHCVCPRPPKNADKYVRGTAVRLRIKDLELSTRFLGSDKDLTILEADCTLLGLAERQH